MQEQQQSRQEEPEEKRAFWKQHIENWRVSGLTQKRYCQKHDLIHHRFTYWKRRFDQTTSGITFVQVPQIRRSITRSSSSQSSALRLVVDENFQIDVGPDFDPQILRRLISTLRTVS